MKRTGILWLWLFIVMLYPFQASAAEQGVFTWMTDYKEDVLSLQKTADGGLISTTYAFGAGSTVMKLNGFGETAWRTYLGYFFPFYAMETSTGEYFVAGRGNESYYSSWYDVFLVKLSSDGTVLWSKTYGNVNSNEEVRSIIEMPDGDFILAGHGTATNGYYSYRSWLCKIGPDGTIRWQKWFGDAFGAFQGSPNMIRSAQRTNDNGIITLSFASTTILLMKFDGEGVLEWKRQYALAGSGGNYPQTVRQLPNGDYVAVGYSYAPRLVNYAFMDSWIIRVDQQGNLVGTSVFTGGNGTYLQFHSVEGTADNGMIIAGHYSIYNYDYALAVKFDANGGIEWKKFYGSEYGGDWDGPNVLPAADGGYFLGGYDQLSVYGVNRMVMKTDGAGNVAGCTGVISYDTFALDPYEDGFLAQENAFVAAEPAIGVNVAAIAGVPKNITPQEVCVVKRPRIETRPAVLDLGAVELHTARMLPIVVANTGNASYPVASIFVEGGNSAEFSLVHDCGSSIPAGGQCSISVTLQPAMLGVRNSSVVISSSESALGQVSVPVIGAGVDTIPPALDIAADRTILWPPNHKMVDVTVTGAAVDAGSGIASLTVTATDEYGTVIPGASGLPATFRLEASRRGHDLDGRTYLITATATDLAGNATTRTLTVLVPHDMGKKDRDEREHDNEEWEHGDHDVNEHSHLPGEVFVE